MESETKSKIEAHIRKHRKSGGGVDDAAEDLKSKPERRNNAPKIEDASEAKEAKKGGRMKRAHGGMAKKEVGMAEGHEGHHHAGRKRRASGGGCESNPFTSAMRGSSPSGRKTMSESKGADH